MMPDFLKTNYLIVGAGLTGLSTAYHLKEDYILVESTNSLGGTAGTLHYKKFKLDNAVHILYFNNKRILEWIKHELQVKLIEKERACAVWIDNRYVKFPIQYNLNDLHLSSRLCSIISICKSFNFSKKKIRYKNFQDYSLNVFGKHLTDNFVRPYNEKLYCTELHKMNTDWMSDYVPTYSKLKMILSMTRLLNTNYGRNFKFFYPAEGGISKIAEHICNSLKVTPIFNINLEKISLKKKVAVFNDGTKIIYNHLINTIPIKYLLQKLDELPEEIKYSMKQLKNNSTTVLHLLVKGTVNDNNYHWVYIPDKSIPFYRITFPQTINPANCPEGYSAVTLEFSGNVRNRQEFLNSSLSTLEKMGVLKVNYATFEYFWKLIKCAYVIYDNYRESALKKIFPFLNRNQIWSVGRYGNWEYSNMEDAIIHGEEIASKLNTQDYGNRSELSNSLYD